MTAGPPLVLLSALLTSYFGHGVADVESKEPITDETVFRVGSLTKTFTGVAVM